MPVGMPAHRGICIIDDTHDFKLRDQKEESELTVVLIIIQ